MNWLCIMLIVLSNVRNPEASAIYKDNVNGVRFESVSPASIANLSCCIHDMEVDRYRPGNMLYIRSSALRSMNMQTKADEVVIDGVFDNPHAFLQMNQTFLLVADTDNYCIRSVTRTDSSSAVLTGSCGSSAASVNGDFKQARFGRLKGVARIPGNAIAIADWGNKCLRKVDLAIEQVTTLVCIAYRPLGLAIQKDTLYFTTSGSTGSVGRYNMTSNTTEYLSSQTATNDGPGDGSLTSADFAGWPISLTFLTADILMVADQPKTIRLINLLNRSISSLCEGLTNHGLASPGNVSSCKVSQPQSIPEENRVLVGFVHSIGEINLGADSECAGARCDDGKCIAYSHLCDGFIDCDGGDDEAGCGITSSDSINVEPQTTPGTASSSIFRNDINGITFTDVNPTSVLNISCCIHDMEVDRFIPGNILYIRSSSLWTMDISTENREVVIDGVFSSPHSFLQFNSTYIIIADTDNFCLRSVARPSSDTAVLAGRCGYDAGYVDGDFQQARFGRLMGTARLPGNVVILADNGNRCLRKVDMDTQEITTLIKLKKSPLGIARQKQKIYFSAVGGHIGYYDLDTGSHQYITSTTEAERGTDGSLSSAAFGGWLITLTFLTEDILMVADQGVTARLVDLRKNTVSSICEKVDRQLVLPGNISECKVFEPQSFLALPGESRILVGFVHSIGEIKVADTDCAGARCDDGTCIAYSHLCDEFVDCDGGDDEAGCGEDSVPQTSAVAPEAPRDGKTTDNVNRGVGRSATKYEALTAGTEAGIAIGVILLLSIIGVLVFFIVRLYRRNRLLTQFAVYTAPTPNTSSEGNVDYHEYSTIDDRTRGKQYDSITVNTTTEEPHYDDINNIHVNAYVNHARI